MPAAARPHGRTTSRSVTASAASRRSVRRSPAAALPQPRPPPCCAPSVSIRVYRIYSLLTATYAREAGGGAARGREPRDSSCLLVLARAWCTAQARRQASIGLVTAGATPLIRPLIRAFTAVVGRLPHPRLAVTGRTTLKRFTDATSVMITKRRPFLLAGMPEAAQRPPAPHPHTQH